MLEQHWIEPIGEPEVESPHEMTNNLSHLLHGHVLADAVGRAQGERYVRVRVVHDLLRVFLHAFCDQPAFRPEGFGIGEVPWVALDGPKVDPRLCAFRNIAGATDVGYQEKKEV